MESRTCRIAAALLTSAILCIGSSASAGESPYRPGAPAPAPPQDFSYFCLAGNVGSFHKLYITAVHHMDWQTNDRAQARTLDIAWTQAIHGQPYPYNARCELTLTDRIQQLRQQMLAQPHTDNVNMDWQYGQAGPATVISSEPVDPSTSPQMKQAQQINQMQQQMNQTGQTLLNSMRKH